MRVRDGSNFIFESFHCLGFLSRESQRPVYVPQSCCDCLSRLYLCRVPHYPSQENSTFLVVGFASDADPAEVPPVYGNVTATGDGTYSVSYTPIYADT